MPYLFANGVRLARVAWEPDATPGVSTLDGDRRVFLEMGDHLGSTSIVLDKATSELVERGTYMAYGAAESDYRPERWDSFREDYRFTGKEEDVEVGLTYFGKRFYAPLLGRWMSADPLGIDAALETDLNLYAYVSGSPLKNIDPLGLAETENSSECATAGCGLSNEAGAENQSLAPPNMSVEPEAVSSGVYAPGFGGSEGAPGDPRGLLGQGGSYGSGAPDPDRTPPDLATPAKELGKDFAVGAGMTAACAATGGVACASIAGGMAAGAETPAEAAAWSALIPVGNVAKSGTAKSAGGGAERAAARAGFAREGVHYELKFIDRHLPGTAAAQRLIRKEGAAHVFKDRATMEMAEKAVLTRGQFTGVVRGSERYGVRFENPIGYRIDTAGIKIPLHYVEAKFNPTTGGYHVIPRTGPSSP